MENSNRNISASVILIVVGICILVSGCVNQPQDNSNTVDASAVVAQPTSTPDATPATIQHNTPPGAGPRGPRTNMSGIREQRVPVAEIQNACKGKGLNDTCAFTITFGNASMNPNNAGSRNITGVCGYRQNYTSQGLVCMPQRIQRPRPDRQQGGQ